MTTVWPNSAASLVAERRPMISEPQLPRSAQDLRNTAREATQPVAPRNGAIVEQGKMAMNRLCRTSAQIIAALVLDVAICSAVLAQEWPARSVRVIVPFAPGGSYDFLTRLVTDELTKRMKQTFIVDNRPGAGGVIGSDMGAKANPDGYALIVTGIASLIIAPAITPVGYDAVKSFSHIALFGGPPEVFVVHPSVPARNIMELLAHVKTRSQGFSYGSGGVGTKGHLLGVLFAELSGANLVHIPYKGGGPAIADLLANQVPSSISSAVSVAQFVKAGKLHALAISSSHRLSDFPDVATFSEAGFPDLLGTSWVALSGPAGLPAVMVNRLNGEVRGILNAPEMRQRLDPQGIEPNDLDPAAFTEYVRSELKRWGPVAQKVK